MVHEPHDALFKDTFTNLQNAADELRVVLPPALATALDWSSLTLESGSFVEAALNKRFSDLLFSIDLAGDLAGDDDRKVFLYLLFEHQSTPDELISFRLLRYEVDIWDRYLQEHEDARRLPAIIPLVLYHGERTWQVPRNFVDLIALEGPARTAALRYLPAFEYVLDNLTATPDALLKQRPMNAESRMVLGALKRGPRGDWWGFLLEWPEVLEEVLGGLDGLSKFAKVLLYLMEQGKASTKQIDDVLKEHVMSESIEKGFVSTADQLRQQGYSRGYDTGQAEKSRAILRKQLARRFGPLSAEVETRIARAEPAQLDHWIEEFAVASTLDEVFRD